MRFLAASLMVVTAMLLTLGNNQAGEKPKYSIKEVMKEAHKGGLMKKVADGKAERPLVLVAGGFFVIISAMLTGPTVVAALKACGVSHVIWIPDSELGAWEQALTGAGGLPLVRVCREGEALAVAAGLLLGGK